MAAVLVISGVFDGPLIRGTPKAVELTVIDDPTLPGGDTLDLSTYGLSVVSNGDGTTGEPEIALSGTATVGDKLYIANDVDGFVEFFGFAPTFANIFISGNGDDAIELFQETAPDTFSVVDVFGDVDVDGSGQPWEYTDGWATRAAGTGPDGSTFNQASWTFSGPNALDDEVNNAEAATPFPIPAVYIVESEGSTVIAEDGTTDTYQVRLNTAPTGPVVVKITPDIQTSLNGAAAGSTVLLTFTPANYNQFQTVTVEAIDDGDPTNNASRSITHSVDSVDPIYDSATADSNVVINIRNSANGATIIPETAVAAGITITESDGSTVVSQGGGFTDTYDVTLNTEPTAPVTVTLSVGAGVEVIPTTLTFNPGEALTQTVTVSGQAGATGTSTISHTATSSDRNYDGGDGILTIADVTVTVADPGITITGVTTEPIAEGLSTTYDVVLNTVPTAPVTVTLAADGETSVNPPTLTFDPNTPGFSLSQTVTVTAVADAILGQGVHTGTVSHTATSADPSYTDLVIDSATIAITDPGIVLVETDGTTVVSEAGDVTDTYSVVLATNPTAPVTVTLNPGIGLSVDQPTLTFNPGGPLTQTVTVTGQAGASIASSITHSATSADPNYDTASGLTIDNNPLGVDITDPGISITGVTANPVQEGTTTTYTVVLNTRPSDVVTINISPDSETTVAPTTLTFDPNSPGFTFSQTVTVTAIADADSTEGAHSSTITHSATSNDTAYNNPVIDSVVLNLIEPGLSIVETDGNTTVSEEGITDQYSIFLNTAPSSPITVTLSPDDDTQITAVDGVPLAAGAPIEVTFTPTDFATPRVITLAAVEDVEAEGVDASTVTHTITASADPDYPVSTALPGITATVIDCFLTGTHLLTEQGERPVEALNIGDRLQTHDGHLAPIKWIGVQTCQTQGCYHPLRAYPICIKAGALGEHRPIRDLYLSPDHAVLVQGLLVNAGALVNGTSIVQITPTTDTFVYYHIELERHSLVIAEGAPAESYLPQKQSRDTFDNGDEYEALYPHSNIQALMPMDYPRVSSKRQLPRFLREHLQAQCQLTGG